MTVPNNIKCTIGNSIFKLSHKFSFLCVDIYDVFKHIFILKNSSIKYCFLFAILWKMKKVFDYKLRLDKRKITKFEYLKDQNSILCESKNIFMIISELSFSELKKLKNSILNIFSVWSLFCSVWGLFKSISYLLLCKTWRLSFCVKVYVFLYHLLFIFLFYSSIQCSLITFVGNYVLFYFVLTL